MANANVPQYIKKIKSKAGLKILERQGTEKIEKDNSGVQSSPTQKQLISHLNSLCGDEGVHNTAKNSPKHLNSQIFIGNLFATKGKMSVQNNKERKQLDLLSGEHPQTTAANSGIVFGIQGVLQRLSKDKSSNFGSSGFGKPDERRAQESACRSRGRAYDANATANTSQKTYHVKNIANNINSPSLKFTKADDKKSQCWEQKDHAQKANENLRKSSKYSNIFHGNSQTANGGRLTGRTASALPSTGDAKKTEPGSRRTRNIGSSNQQCKSKTRATSRRALQGQPSAGQHRPTHQRTNSKSLEGTAGCQSKALIETKSLASLKKDLKTKATATATLHQHKGYKKSQLYKSHTEHEPRADEPPANDESDGRSEYPKKEKSEM